MSVAHPADCATRGAEIERRVRCGSCGLKDYLVVAFHIPTTEERMAMRIRRLAGVRYVRKVIWQDD